MDQRRQPALIGDDDGSRAALFRFDQGQRFRDRGHHRLFEQQVETGIDHREGIGGMEDVGRRYVDRIQPTGLSLQHGFVGGVFGRARPAGGGANVT